jgi:transcriptional regulator GlxA family with amidase domain
MAEINFGFLLIPLQLLDMAGPMDIVGNISREVIERYGTAELAKSAPMIKFFHIASTMDPVPLTGGFKAQPTTTIANCPKLDYLLIGGPSPEYAADLPEDVRQFIVDSSKTVKSLFTTCTGGLVLAATGVLDGVSATVNHTLIDRGREIAPKVKWNGQKNWVVDGKFWTAAGAVAGMDMVSSWVQQCFGVDLLNFSTMLLEYQPRDEDGRPVTFMNGRGEIVSV